MPCVIFLSHLLLYNFFKKPSQMVIINKCEKRESLSSIDFFLDDDDDDSEESEHKNVCIMRMHEMHLSLQFNNSRFVVSMIAMAIYFHSWLELSSWPRFFYFKKYTYIAAALSVHCFLFSL